MKRLVTILPALISLVLVSCAGPWGQILPAKAKINLSNDTLTRFDEEARSILIRYLAGNGRWEVREEQGAVYAIRRELVDGRYESTLNGFYSYQEGAEYHQTRVILSFDQPYGFGNNRESVTRAQAGSSDVSITVVGSHFGTPGCSSYVIIEGAGVFLEIYEQSPENERRFTQEAFNGVSSELSDVLGHLDEIEATGILPVESQYPEPQPLSAYFDVGGDGRFQRGIYSLEAAVAPTSSGMVYAKVYDVATGQRLSAEDITWRSTRIVGWSSSGTTLFPYNAVVFVYGGEKGVEFRARFELWHRDQSGREVKLIETSRAVFGWNR